VTLTAGSQRTLGTVFTHRYSPSCRYRHAIESECSNRFARRSSGSSRIAALTPRDCSRRLRFPSVSSSSAVGSSGASSRRSKIQALQFASFLAAFSAPASGRCKLVNQRIRTEYYWRFTDAAVRVAIKRTTFRFRKKLRVVRLT
jgi:hypothetical protein